MHKDFARSPEIFEIRGLICSQWVRYHSLFACLPLSGVACARNKMNASPQDPEALRAFKQTRAAEQPRLEISTVSVTLIEAHLWLGVFRLRCQETVVHRLQPSGLPTIIDNPRAPGPLPQYRSFPMILCNAWRLRTQQIRFDARCTATHHQYPSRKCSRPVVQTWYCA